MKYHKQGNLIFIWSMCPWGPIIDVWNYVRHLVEDFVEVFKKDLPKITLGLWGLRHLVTVPRKKAKMKTNTVTQIQRKPLKINPSLNKKTFQTIFEPLSPWQSWWPGTKKSDTGQHTKFSLLSLWTHHALFQPHSDICLYTREECPSQCQYEIEK